TLIYLCIDASLGGRVVLLLLIGDSLNGFFKMIFHLPRPYWIDSNVKALAQETSYGLPSGHAQDATTVWFFIAYTMRKRWAWLVALALVLLISLSRLYLGVHFSLDVIGGWIIGGIFLAAYLWIEPMIKDRLLKLGMWGQIGVSLGAAFLVILLGVAAQAAIASSPDPASWALFAKDARSLETFVSRAGALFGAGAGLAMMVHGAQFNAGGSFKNRAIRFVVGISGVLVLRFGLSAIFPKEPEMIGFFFRFVRYAIMLWWAMYLAPWLLLKMKLAERG
ncbi:MAG: phosphatase PAP2 family protein, partial [Chloroflexi bacterium]|nr:phosphatase PAP2 family protein [Chloroflexota bacterium]